MAYAAKPRGRVARPKDVVWTKNLYVAAGITSFAGLAAVAAASSVDGPAGWIAAARSHGPGFLTACALVGARVLLDAALCDIDDEGTDSAHGTHTFSTRWGVARAWWVTGAARAALMAAVVLARPCPWPARAVWACAMAMGTVALRLRRPARLRDLVDARFFVEAAGATAMLASWQMG